ncbi:MAG: sugar phosphate isomerase/epimerase [Verrucomicrobia bacterium]|nr:sugar phosphate isomerase/epimerase [Verrucomicrobiota bacterium]
MNTQPLSTRREFLGQVATAGAAAALLPAGEAFAAAKTKSYPIIAFSKPFAHLGPKETADFVADIGWDGIELPVRAKATQIAPEKVEEDLPKFVEALKKNGREVSIVTSDITAVNPLAEKVLRTCARLGIKKYRLGFWKYAKDKSIPDSVAEIGVALKDIAALNKQLGLQAGFQNHSGADYVGASLWDLWTMMKDLDPKHMGVCYDIGHSTLEGGLSWPVQARLMEPRYVAVYFKDFYWEKGAKGWAPRWCALGEGSVQKSFVTNLKKSSFNGPLSQHHEYKDLGEGAAMVKNMKKDLATLREWLAA